MVILAAMLYYEGRGKKIIRTIRVGCFLDLRLFYLGVRELRKYLIIDILQTAKSSISY